ncbi:hypothetical protein SRHO_G00153980 [Serrasalmus rhombeus]
MRAVLAPAWRAARLFSLPRGRFFTSVEPKQRCSAVCKSVYERVCSPASTLCFAPTAWREPGSLYKVDRQGRRPKRERRSFRRGTKCLGLCRLNGGVEALSSLRRWDASSFGPVALQAALCALKRILPPTLCVDPYRLGAETASWGPCPSGILHGRQSLRPPAWTTKPSSKKPVPASIKLTG